MEEIFRVICVVETEVEDFTERVEGGSKIRREIVY